jgi:hypothetical protein
MRTFLSHCGDREVLLAFLLLIAAVVILLNS